MDTVLSVKRVNIVEPDNAQLVDDIVKKNASGALSDSTMLTSFILELYPPVLLISWPKY